MEGNEERKNNIKESVSEQSGRTSFATKVRENEQDEEKRQALSALKSKKDDDLVFLVVSPILLVLGVAFIFVSVNKIEGVVNPLSFAFIVSMICFALGAFFLVFGGIRFILHNKAIKQIKTRE